MGSLIPTDANLPAHLQGANLADENKALITAGAPSFPMLTLRGREFRMRNGDDERKLGLTELKIVIVATTPNSNLNAKTYYEGDYVPGSSEAPDCSSSNGVAPDEHSLKKQAGDCTTCPKNAWGSAKSMSGKDSKACKDTKMLYFVSPDKADGTIAAVRVPTMSLRHLSKFARELSARKIPVSSVIVTISFVDSEYPEIGFGFGGFLSENQYLAVRERIASSDVVEILAGETYATETLVQPASDIPEMPAHLKEDAEDEEIREGDVERTIASGSGMADAIEVASNAAAAQAREHRETLEIPDQSSGGVVGDIFGDTEPAAAKTEPLSEIEKLKAQLAALQGGTTAEATPPPASQGATPTVDSTGRAWDARIDSSSKKFVKSNGRWARRKNVEDAVYSAVITELAGIAFAKDESEPTQTTTPASTMFPDTEPATTAPPAAGPDVGDGGELDDLLADWG